jgi:hypothetical protein
MGSTEIQHPRKLSLIFLHCLMESAFFVVLLVGVLGDVFVSSAEPVHVEYYVNSPCRNCTDYRGAVKRGGHTIQEKGMRAVGMRTEGLESEGYQFFWRALREFLQSGLLRRRKLGGTA